MPDIILSSIEYTGYISIIKYATVLVLFFLWAPLLNWVYKDALNIGTKEDFWTGIVFGAGAFGILLLMIFPIFIVGLIICIGALGGSSFAYISHRNKNVMEFERVLTVDHIKGLLSKEGKSTDTIESFKFFTANKNEVPIPEPKTPEFYGYRITHDVLTDATWKRASNIIFMPGAGNYSVTYNVDGVAVQQPAIDKDRMERLIRFIKNLADLDIEEKRKPQKGKFRTARERETIEWEVNTAGSTAGEKVRIKHIEEETISKLSDIGLSTKELEPLIGLRDKEQGLFIISGPKKSGVSTTFYAFIRNHDPFINNVNTLEIQPTVQLGNVTQNTYNLSDSSVHTYARKLQEISRLGADVIGVADCTDAQTARAACEAAMSKKVVYVMLESNNVSDALRKWIKLVDDKKIAIKPLLGAINQRLVRKLCEECKQGYQPNKELLRKFNIPADKAKILYKPGKVKYDKRGKGTTCPACHGTGFLGRVGVFEALILDDEQLRKEIIGLKSLSEIGSYLRRTKMRYLQEQMLKKVIGGTTAINEMVRILSRKEKNKKREK
ncbi:MAG: GspE/PulE family protein [Planctomycetota bacterium]|jgi:type II secretory ATPase GspE/PulE/Tfp pilus assembly ATPase PilB-like protein